jgi:NAD-dependent dihydropyrimidine dehydrogenase PreA subunit
MCVNESLCTGCGECVDVCPSGAIRMVNSVAQIERSLCQECEACVYACPNRAILVLQELPAAKQPIAVQPPMPVSEPVSSRSKVRPAIGAVFAFVGQEIAPRMIRVLLNAWDRRQARSDIVSSPVVDVTGRVGYDPRGGGRRMRRRGGRR